MSATMEVIDDDGTEWERYRYPHGEVIDQRPCPSCDGGLLYAPVRFCGRCGGDGFVIRKVASRSGE